jgi:hypothetical protein
MVSWNHSQLAMESMQVLVSRSHSVTQTSCQATHLLLAGVIHNLQQMPR